MQSLAGPHLTAEQRPNSAGSARTRIMLRRQTSKNRGSPPFLQATLHLCQQCQSTLLCQWQAGYTSIKLGTRQSC